MQNISKPFAPFGAVIHQLRQQLPLIKTSLYFFVGRFAYDEAKKFWENGQASFCLPMGKNLIDFEWPIEGLNLILFDTGSMSNLHLSRLSLDLLKLNAKVVCIHSEKNESAIIHTFKKELRYDRGIKA